MTDPRTKTYSNIQQVPDGVSSHAAAFAAQYPQEPRATQAELDETRENLNDAIQLARVVGGRTTLYVTSEELRAYAESQLPPELKECCRIVVYR